jgi:DNA-directed RNA polymerase subunit RPC12/RpoP
MVPNFNEYVGAGVLAGVSDLYVLSATPNSEPLVTGEFDQPLYTGQVRPTIRTYVCMSCGTQYEVGGEAGGQFATIEVLKEQGCPSCGSTSFRLISRRSMPRNGSEGEP